MSKRRTLSSFLSTVCAAAMLGLAGCAGGGNGSPAAVANATPDSRGVITYATYQVAVARDGDTVATLSERVGASADAVARLNGLPMDYLLRAGEIVILPDDVPRPAEPPASVGWTPEVAAAAIDAAPAPLPAPGDVANVRAAPPADNPFRNGQSSPLIDPVRHRVEAGETVYSIARLYGVSVTSLASWNGLGPDMAIRTNQELLIPIVSGANQISDGADTQPGQGTTVAPPPLAAQPLPENIAPGEEPASPNLGQYRTPPGGRLEKPVNASISRPFDPANPNGVGFAVSAGATVRAAGQGEVALVSEEKGGSGLIVLIRHGDDLLTTYSLLQDVTVKKGDRVQAGQTIGKVAASANPQFQFNVFRNTTELDPAEYIGG